MDFSHKPRATIVADGWWDHDEIRMGSRTWQPVAGLLQTSGGAAEPAGQEGGAEGPGLSAALTNLLAWGARSWAPAPGSPFRSSRACVK